MFKMPSTRAGFWRTKIEQNMKRDQRAQAKLILAGNAHLEVQQGCPLVPCSMPLCDGFAKMKTEA
jgi:G:T-mismatch repair DNA endonuclease (very short patch repair protein)